MKGNILSRWLLLVWLGLWLTGCQTLSESGTHTTSTTADSQRGSEITKAIMPGVAIDSGTPKAVLDAVAREWVKKRMKVKARDTYSLHMALIVPHTKKLTEAQMVYTLYRYQGKLWLSAKVYQVASPSAEQEDILDITQRVKKEMQLELTKIAKRFAK